MPYVYTVNGEPRLYAYAYLKSGEILKFRTDTGDVVQRSGASFEPMRWAPDGSWIIRGAYEARPFGRRRFWSREAFLDYAGANGKHLKFKNGSSRFYLADIDHGTCRMHGDSVRALTLLSD
jgi:hypothetical protein